MRLNIWIAALALLCCSAFSQVPKTWLSFKTTEFQVSYPPTWKLDKSGIQNTKFVLFAPKDSAGIRSVISLNAQQEDGDTISADSMMRINTNNLPYSIENFKVLQKELVTVNGVSCFRLTFQGTQAGREQTFVQQGCRIKNQYYVLNYTALNRNFHKYLPDVLILFDNITWIR